MIQVVGEGLIPRVVLRQSCVQKVDGDAVPRHAAHKKAPCAHLDLPPLDSHRYAGLQGFQEFLRIPDGRALRLVSVGIQMLTEVALTVEEAHTQHGHSQISGGS